VLQVSRDLVDLCQGIIRQALPQTSSKRPGCHVDVVILLVGSKVLCIESAKRTVNGKPAAPLKLSSQFLFLLIWLVRSHLQPLNQEVTASNNDEVYAEQIYHANSNEWLYLYAKNIVGPLTMVILCSGTSRLILQ
jgi:hypothetical protein